MSALKSPAARLVAYRVLEISLLPMLTVKPSHGPEIRAVRAPDGTWAWKGKKSLSRELAREYSFELEDYYQSVQSADAYLDLCPGCGTHLQIDICLECDK